MKVKRRTKQAIAVVLFLCLVLLVGGNASPGQAGGPQTRETVDTQVSFDNASPTAPESDEPAGQIDEDAARQEEGIAVGGRDRPPRQPAAIEPASLCTWTGAASPDFADPGNWDCGHVPLNTETAVISPTTNLPIISTTLPVTNVGHITILPDAVLTVASNGQFNLQGNLTHLGTLDIAGRVNWATGSMQDGGTVNILAGGTLSITGVGTKSIIGTRIVNNAGTATLQDTGPLYIYNGGVFNNYGTFEVRSDAPINYLTGTSGAFNNYGVFRKAAGSGATTIGRTTSASPNLTFNNAGTTEVLVGTLWLAGGGLSSGAFSGAAGTTLRFDRAVHTLSASSSLASSGAVDFKGGTTTIGGTYSVSGTTTMSGTGNPKVNFDGPVRAISLSLSSGTAKFNHAVPATAASLNMTGGTLGGTGSISITNLNWSGGIMAEPGRTIVPPGGILDMGGTAGRTLSGTRTLANEGAAAWTGGALNFYDGAVLDNRGDFDIASDAPMTFWSGATPAFNNSGALRKTAGGGTTAIAGIPFINSGTVRVLTGTLDFQSGYTQTAGLTLLAGGNLAAGGSSGGGAGLAAAGGNIYIGGGTLAGRGTISGTVHNAGTIARGALPGIFRIAGDYVQDRRGALNLVLGGLTPDSHFDRFHVTGNATLDGSLNIFLSEGFTPATGNTFQILAFLSRVGTFATITGQALGGGRDLVPSYDGEGLTLSVIEPLATATPTSTPTATPPPAFELVTRLGGPLYAIATEGHYAYVGIGSRLTTLDVAAPTNPVQTGQSAPMPGVIQDVAIQGDYAYVADDVGGLRIVDVRFPANPIEVGHLDTPGLAYAVAVSGTYAYLAEKPTTGGGGLRIVDVSNPASPVAKGFYDSPGQPQGVDVAGRYAYLADDDRGLHILDVGNPLSPTLASSFLAPGYVKDVFLSGSRAYLAAYASGLRIVDVSNPAAPVSLGQYTPLAGSYVYKVLVSGSNAYLQEGVSMEVVDISYPSSPVRRGWESLISSFSYHMAMLGNYVYVAGGEEGMMIVDFTNLSNPAVAGKYVPLTYASDLRLSGNYAYVAGGHGGFHIVDLTSPPYPVRRGFVDTSNAATLELSGNYAYVVDSHDGVRIIDVSSRSSPMEVGRFVPSQVRATQDVAVNGNYAYAVDGDSLYVFDASDILSPSLRALFYNVEYPNSIALNGTYAYVADGGLRILDISNPALPQEVANLTSFYATGVEVRGHYAYLWWSKYMEIVDIANPASPVVLGTYYAPEAIWRVTPIDNFVLIADGLGGVRLVDVSFPLAPVEVAAYDTAGEAMGVAVSGSHAYVADRNGGLVVLRFNQPSSLPTPTPTATATATRTSTPTGTWTPGSSPTPSATGTATATRTPTPDPILELVGQTGGPLNAVAIQGNHPVVGIGPRLAVMENSNPASPSIAGQSSPVNGVVQAVAVQGSYAYVAAGEDGLRIANIAFPTSPSLVGHYDSPGDASSVAVSGTYAYLAEKPLSVGGQVIGGGLRVINTANLALPVETGFYDSPGKPFHVALYSHYAYLADDDRGLRVVDVANPISPTEVYNLSFPGHTTGIAIAGRYAYVASNESGLHILDLANPARPFEVANYIGTAFYPKHLVVVGSYAYAITYDFLFVIDVSNPANPVEADKINPLGHPQQLAAAGGYLYVALGDDGLRVIDISQPTSLELVGLFATLADVQDVALANGYAYVGGGHSGLWTVDIANPDRPATLGHLDTGNSTAIEVSGSTLYANDGYHGLVVADFSDARNPLQLGFYASSESYFDQDVAVGAGHAYYIDGDFIYILDVSNPAAIRLEAPIQDPNGLSRLALVGDYLYIAAGGLRIFDVSNPGVPKEVSLIERSGGRAVTVSGRYAYLGVNYEVLIFDISNPANPIEVGYIRTSDLAVGMAVQGAFLFIAEGQAGVRVADISDPSSPLDMGAFKIGGRAKNVAVAGDYVYVAAEQGGLIVLRFSGPPPRPTPTPTATGTATKTKTPGPSATPTTTATATPPPPFEFLGQLGGPANAVAVQGNDVYLGVGQRLVALDASDSANPLVVGQSASLYVFVQGIAIGNGYAYVAANEKGLRILDISGVSNPTEVGHHDTPGYAYAVAVSGTYAYVADKPISIDGVLVGGGLRIVNVANPTLPSGAGFYDSPGQPRDVALLGKYAYVADDDEGLRVVDVSNPASPVEVASFSFSGRTTAIAISGRYAYVVADASGLHVLSLANPAAPVEVAILSEDHVYPLDLAVSGSKLYFLAGGSVYTVDISDPANPLRLTYRSLNGNPRQLAASSTHIYVAAGDDGLIILDITQPGNPPIVGGYQALADVQAISLAGNYAYVAGGHSGLWAVDLANPANPFALGRVQASDATAVDVSGSYVFANDGYFGMIVADFSDRAHPTQVGYYATSSVFFDRAVAVGGDFAYYVEDQHIIILNISNPAAPRQEALYQDPDYAYALALAGDRLYYAGGAGLTILDVSNPTVPRKLGSLQFNSSARAISVSGNYAYVGTDWGVRIVEISDPASPRQVGVYEVPDLPVGMALSGRYLFVADGADGVRVADVSAPSSPVEIGHYAMTGRVQGIAVAGSYVYLANEDGGLAVLRFVAPSAATATPTATATATSTATAGATTTPTGTASLLGRIWLQGRGVPPNSRWVMPLRVTLHAPGVITPTLSLFPTTNDSGQFAVSGITPGVYDVRVKKLRSLAIRRHDVTLVAGNNFLEMGTLSDGDANEDGIINSLDYAHLAAVYYRDRGQPGFDERADFNDDGWINVLDYAVLAFNYFKQSPDQP